MRFTVSQTPKLVEYFYKSDIASKYYKLLIEVVKEN